MRYYCSLILGISLYLVFFENKISQILAEHARISDSRRQYHQTYIIYNIDFFFLGIFCHLQVSMDSLRHWALNYR